MLKVEKYCIHEFMRIHFISVDKGASYRLSRALKGEGHYVTHSDGKLPEQVIPEIDAIVIDSYESSDSLELRKAKSLRLKIYTYSEFLYHLYKDKTRIVIAGTHGKTTIISMVMHVLDFHKKSIDYVVGIQPECSDINVKLSKENDFIILEYNEYTSSEIGYKPNIALIGCVEQGDIIHFQRFVDSIIPGGIVIYNQEDLELVKIIENTNNCLRKIPYNIPNHEIYNGKFNLLTMIGNIPLSVIGEHNLQNIEASRNICQQLGIMEEEFYEAVIDFSL